MFDTIVCPNCGREIAVSETVTAQIRQEVSNRLGLERNRLIEEAHNKAKDAVALEIVDLTAQLGDAKDKLTKANEAWSAPRFLVHPKWESH